MEVITGKTKQPRRILLYGVAGIGKSTWASMADNPIFIQTEDGLDDIGCPRFPMARAFYDVMSALKILANEKHEYKTVVVDSLDWLEKLIWVEVCENRNVKSIEDIGYAKGYTFALTQWREFLSKLSGLRCAHDMQVILIAHSKIERFENPETETYSMYTPGLHKHASALVQEWCDEVLFASWRVMTKKTEEGFNRSRAQGIGTGERIIRTTCRPAHAAKNRLGLPDELPMDYREFAKYI